jgi:hypothetical protein
MAKKRVKRGGPRSSSKAQAVRDEFAAQGADARPKDVIAALKAKGIEVAPAQVSNIKATLSSKKGAKKSKGGAAHANGELSLDSLLEAKKLAERLGGVEVALKALTALSRLQ